jgi:septal ring factor EnvC (AmiA/AmiB activator)
MPSWENWFSGTALFLAGSFLFAISVGIIGIREMISDRTFLAFMFIALNLGLLAWYTAAKQESENTNLKTTLSRIAESIKPEPQTPDFVEAATRANPVQLRETVSNFTQELRTFQNEISEIDGRISNQEFDENGKSDQLTPEQKGDQFWRRAHARDARMLQWTHQFQTRFRSRAIALRDEMARRLGLNLSTRTDFRWACLDTGSLAGYKPLAELADVLDEAAKKLR